MPVLARVYHIAPMDQTGLTLTQFRLLQRDYEESLREEG